MLVFNRMVQIALIIHDVRSAHNVGSLLRTADGLGVKKVYLTGFTPYPQTLADERPPHVRRAVSAKIKKTALGAENSVRWRYKKDILGVISRLKTDGWTVAVLEQSPKSVSLVNFRPAADKIAMIVGNETGGLGSDILKAADLCLQIPMAGAKESFNVAAAGAMALYHLRYWHKRN